jgi:hypothetical protein
MADFTVALKEVIPDSFKALSKHTFDGVSSFPDWVYGTLSHSTSVPLKPANKHVKPLPEALIDIVESELIVVCSVIYIGPKQLVICCPATNLLAF